MSSLRAGFQIIRSAVGKEEENKEDEDRDVTDSLHPLMGGI